MNINHNYYLLYRLFNSIFLGLSIGTVMTIYAPLQPSIYSLGGIALALGMMALALLYEKILTIEWFAFFSILVEAIMVAVILIFLIFIFDYKTALMIYIGYQLTFIFGGYLVRAETLFLSDPNMLKKIDIVKQIGTLAGMGFGYLVYQILNEKSNIEQVYDMHYLLILVQIMVLFFVVRAFRKS